MSKMRPALLSLSIALLLLAAALIALPSAQAQDGLRMIPILGMQPVYHLSPDGQLAAVFEMGAFHGNEIASQYLAIRLIDLASGTKVQELTGITDFATDVAFSPDGTQLVSYQQNGYLVVWDVATGQQVKVIPALPGGARVLFTPDGASLITLTNSGYVPQILYWDLASGAITHILTLRFETWLEMIGLQSSIQQSGQYSITALAQAPDGSQLITSSYNQDLWAWSPDADQPTRLLKGGEQPTFGTGLLAFTPDGSRLIYLDTASGDTSTLYALDLASQTSTPLADLGDSRVFALAPDGESFAWLPKDASVIHVASLADPTATTDIPFTVPDFLTAKSLVAYRSPQAALTYAPDGQSLILGGFADTDSDVNALFVIPLP